MKWYAQHGVRRARQVALDLVVVLWCYGWVRLARSVRAAVLRLQEPGRLLQTAGDGLGNGLDDAARRVSGAPLVGDRLADPLTAAANAGHTVAGAGVAVQTTVSTLATLLALLVAIVPIVLVAALWLFHRLRFARQAAAAGRLRSDVDLLALRAVATLPLSTLARLGPDPVGRWRRGDPQAAAQLADLVLRDCGVRTGRS